MSNSLAVAAVTATLQSILQHEVMTESDLSDLSSRSISRAARTRTTS